MNVLDTEDLALEVIDLREDLTPITPTVPVQLQPTQLILAEQQEAFLRDRFTTKLEDPQTGRWIRSWRAEGTTP